MWALRSFLEAFQVSRMEQYRAHPILTGLIPGSPTLGERLVQL